MNPELMDILVCPVCKSEFELKVDEEKDGDIVTGSLFCQKCSHNYLISDSIPHLLPPNV